MKFIGSLMNKLPLKKIIVFESNPDFACNTYPVYKKIKNDPFFDKYKIVWVLKDKDKTQSHILKKPNNYFEKIKSFFYRHTAECMVSCNQILTRTRHDQLTVFLSHGSKTKKTKGICEIGQTVDYVLCQSHFFDDVIKYEYDLIDDQLVYLGYPRCDYLYNCDKNIIDILNFNKNSKYLIWLPTFRKNKNYSTNDTVSNYDNIGMPIIYDVDTLKKFDNFLIEKNMYVIYKPHPAQDISSILTVNLTNVLIINDDYLKEKGLQLYEVISKSSALITDYSSVYFDYLLLNKPIATTNDDAEEWKSSRGFAFDLELYYDKTTERISNYDDMCRFIENVNNEIDLKRSEREKIRDLTNLYNDGNSTERVVEFIKKEIQKRH